MLAPRPGDVLGRPTSAPVARRVSTSGEPMRIALARMSKKQVRAGRTRRPRGAGRGSHRRGLRRDEQERDPVHRRQDAGGAHLQGTVRDVLASQHIDLSSHDVVAPSPDSGSATARASRCATAGRSTVNLDGEKTTATGPPPPTSAARSTSSACGSPARTLGQPLGATIGRAGMALRIVTPKTLTVKIGGAKPAEDQRHRAHRRRGARQARTSATTERQGQARPRRRS